MIGKKIKRITVSVLTAAILAASFHVAMPAKATSISDAENKISNTQQLIEEINNKISSLADEQSVVNEMIDDLNAEIVNTMTSISMKEDEISEKEKEITETEYDIEMTEAEYEKAKAREEQQYNDMVSQIRFMYENGDVSYAALLMAGEGLSDALNKIDYMESVYEYSHTKLVEYEKAKEDVQALWDVLENDKGLLEEQKEKMEADKVYLNDLNEELNRRLAKKKAESANYEAEIKKARQDAAIAKTQLQKEQQELKRLQEEAARQAALAKVAAAASANANANSNSDANNSTGNGNSSTTSSSAASAAAPGNSAAATATYATTDYTQIIDSSEGSALGKQVAKYACQFIGNPYVYGGTSLTSGADCSGFTYRVYSDFNYSLPRTSYEQRSVGTGVSYESAQPGDIICYDGHVAIYIGQGLIVHAADSSTGIIIGRATYRSILAVRRIV